MAERILWLDAGNIFGKSGEGFERINAACPRSILDEALKRLERNIVDEEDMIWKGTENEQN